MNDPNDPSDPRLDAALRDAFAPPPADVFAAMARKAVAGPAVARARPRPWPWLVAAAAALLVLAVWLAPRAAPPAGTADGAALGRLWAAAYVDAEARGFGDGSCCQPGVDLPNVCRERFAAGLTLAEGASLSLLGCYCGLPTGESVALLGRTGDARVCVCVVPRATDPGVVLADDSGLHLVRREVGALVVYALSRQPIAGVLDQFCEP
jgi:hypothetical protein